MSVWVPLISALIGAVVIYFSSIAVVWLLLRHQRAHKYLETTVIYMDAVGEEERELAAMIWD